MQREDRKQAEALMAPDLVLLLLGAPTGTKSVQNRLDGITRLEKLLFLADQESSVSSKVQNPFEFKAYDFGPYSKAVYEAVDLLEQAGLVQEDRAFQGQSLDDLEEAIALEEREGVERRFWLTESGQAVARLLASQHPDVAKDLGAIKGRYADMPLRRLIRYVYVRYPEYAEASKIRDQML
jgi:uncharacterized protein